MAVDPHGRARKSLPVVPTIHAPPHCQLRFASAARSRRPALPCLPALPVNWGTTAPLAAVTGRAPRSGDGYACFVDVAATVLHGAFGALGLELGRAGEESRAGREAEQG